MAMACGSRLASSLLQESLPTNVAFSGAGRADVRRVSSSSSSQLRPGTGVLRRTYRLPAFSVVRLSLCCIVSFDSYVDSDMVMYGFYDYDCTMTNSVGILEFLRWQGKSRWGLIEDLCKLSDFLLWRLT